VGVKSYVCQWLFMIIIIGQFLLISCGGDSEVVPSTETQVAIDKELIQTYLSENAITAAEDESGIYYYPLIENATGNSQQVSGSILSIYYSVEVLNGQIVDEVLASQNELPYKLKHGVNSIVPVGLDLGLAYMQEGETFVFLIPSALAYVDLSFSTLIPANSVIKIQVELVKIENEQDQSTIDAVLIADYILAKELNDLVKNPLDNVILLASGVYYKRISEGAIGEMVFPGQTISTIYTGSFLNDIVFDRISGNETFDYVFNSNIVVDGMDLGIAEMEKGERAIIIIPSAKGYAQSVGVVPSILKDKLVDLEIIPEYSAKVDPYQVLVFDIRLL
jgi:FKBP-type peptidyl-prolyl cis-trans isomerase